jgi:hypothetical protein
MPPMIHEARRLASPGRALPGALIFRPVISPARRFPLACRADRLAECAPAALPECAGAPH